MSVNDWMKLGGVLVFAVGMLAIAVNLLYLALDLDLFDFYVDDDRE